MALSTIRFKVIGRVGNWRLVCRQGRALAVANVLTHEQIVVFPHQICWNWKV
jgi:hypothetical protein